jgi:hypothetical protein
MYPSLKELEKQITGQFMIPWYLGPFDTKLNIIFKNVEIFKFYFFQIRQYCEG